MLSGVTRFNGFTQLNSFVAHHRFNSRSSINMFRTGIKGYPCASRHIVFFTY